MTAGRCGGRILRQSTAAVPPANRLGGGGDIVDSHVDVDVVQDTRDLQRSFDARYGRSLVRVRSALVRVIGHPPAEGESRSRAHHGRSVCEEGAGVCQSSAS